MPSHDREPIWLTLSELLDLHRRVIEVSGGPAGVLKPSSVEYALERPLTAFGGVELFPTLWLKVAAVTHSIATTHPFVDGNKRTALVLADALMELNGYLLTAEEDEVVKMVLALAEGAVSLESLADWLETNSVKLRA